jgi:type I restriction enzyme R subunit
METLEAKEKYLCQIPAMQVLMRLGYTCLPQKEATVERGREKEVLLTDILTEQILRINSFTYRGNRYSFNRGDAEEAIRRLKPSPVEQKGLLRTNQDIYDLLLLGTAVEKVIDGDRKSYSLRYIDWDNPENNVYHATVEMSVDCVGTTPPTQRCDIVLFVNGIPFVVIENKAPKEKVQDGIKQLIKYQGYDYIPHLFHYVQLVIATNKNDVRYGTVGTPRKYWQIWREQEDKEEEISALINRPLKDDEKAVLFLGTFSEARHYFEQMALAGERAVTEQDRVLYALCRPERLLELVRIFTVFDAGVRKIARYQQFFGIRRMLQRIRQSDHEGKRRGGVIWHWQGSGKSLTMVMLGKALALADDIPSSRIIIVTDRIDLDDQIKDTFRSCDMEPVRANTGVHLIECLENRRPLITSVINKFDSATRHRHFKDNDPNLFALVDESHRTQYGTFAAKMRRILSKACYIGFTGTPLLKKEKNTMRKFGELIHMYTMDEAVRDGVIVPLLYEGRYVEQHLTGTVIDTWFERLCRGLTGEQKADLKLKFSRMDILAKTEQAIYAKAMDISEHFRQTWQGTGRKAQLVAPSKRAAIRFKEILDEIGHVSSEVIISPPDDREGSDEVDAFSKDDVRAFWNHMMRKYGSEEEYNRQIISAFKGTGDPEILIVVSKLLTGFDVPRNTVLYVCKSLQGHNLLQAIARVNRIFEENGIAKQYGYVIDYEGLLGELDQALTEYRALEGYDEKDLVGVVIDVREEIRKLPGLHESLWDIFKEVPNKLDHEQMEQHLYDKPRRDDFYAKLKAYGRCLHRVLSSEKAYDVFSDDQLDIFKRDWKRLSSLRQSVRIRYQEIADISDYEPKIAKLLDDHVVAQPAEIIVKQVNLNDPKAVEKVLEEQHITDASKADRIASATKKTIEERMDTDPAFYKKFSELLEEVIKAYRDRRMSEKEYVSNTTAIARKVAAGKREEDTVPVQIRDNSDAQAFYGVLTPIVERHLGEADGARELAARFAVDLLNIVTEHLIVNLWDNEDAVNQLRNAIDDYFFDLAAPTMGIKLNTKELDNIEQELLDIAQARFR